MALTGHAHIDTAWLWPIEETRRKVRRTFSTAVDLLRRHPQFRFTQSFAEYYRQLEDDDPELLKAIKAEVKAGRWEPVGGLWVEPDINMPSGESLVRQALYGQRYFQRTFGTRHRAAWLPDTFGFSPALPQILKGAGLETLYTVKIGWSETNRFPHSRFWWEGIDGSRLLVHHMIHPGGQLQRHGDAALAASRSGATTPTRPSRPRCCCRSASATAAADRPPR